MNLYKSFGIINRDLDLLAPFVRERAVIACHNAQNAGYPVSIFEGYRSPARQDMLYEQGRTTSGKIVTNQRGWNSWHQYGLAFDIAYLIKGQWSWNGDFDKAARFFMDEGFEWLSPFEKAHFQLTGKLTIEYAREVTEKFGLLSLWGVVKENL